MNKNNPFSGGKQCFCKQRNKKQKTKKKFRANCPKTHVQGCVDPSWRRKRRKEQNTKRREGIFKRSLFKFAKTLSKKEHRKTRKNHLHRSRKQISGNGPNRAQTATELQKRKRAKKFTNWSPPGKNGKNVILKISSILQPQAVFCLAKPIWSKIRTSEKKKKFVRPRKICVKNVLQHQGDTTGPTQINQAPQRKIGPKPLVLKGFASYYLLDCAWKSPDQKHAQKTKIFPDRKKRPRRPPKWHFWKARKIRKQWGYLVSRNPHENDFALQKRWFQKGGGRKWTLGGPQMNSRNPFWGAANEPSSIYIYLSKIRKVKNCISIWFRNWILLLRQAILWALEICGKNMQSHYDYVKKLR